MDFVAEGQIRPNGSGILIVAYDGTYPRRDGDPYAERILRERLIN
jgi:hypothetical protein